jgi:hypothetical protein
MLLLGHATILLTLCDFKPNRHQRFSTKLSTQSRHFLGHSTYLIALAIEIVLPSLIGNSTLGNILDIAVEMPRIEATIETKYFM